MLTTSEVALLVAGIGVGGVALGSALTWLIGKKAAYKQWEHDRKHQLAARRAELYIEAIAQMENRGQQLYTLLIDEIDKGQSGLDVLLRDPDVDQWNARVELFASNEVRELWREWMLAVATRSPTVAQAKAALVARMREEANDY